VNVRANKSGEKKKSHTEGSCRARPQIDSTQEDFPGSSGCMSKATSFELGEEQRKQTRQPH